MFPAKPAAAGSMIAAAFLLLFTTFAQAQNAQTDGPPTLPPTQTEYVIVTLQDSPVATYTGSIAGYPATKPARGQKLDLSSPAVQNYLKRLNSAHANFRSFVGGNAPQARVVRDFVLVQNAVAVQLNGVSPATLAKAPGVKDVTYSVLYKPTMDVSVNLIKASDVWPAVGGRSNAGAGVKVGVIDSGIQDNHPFLSCHKPVQHKQYASGVVGFDPNHIITGTHGTHVSGTIAGCVTTFTSGVLAGKTMSGIAPAAELHDYNVFPGFGVGHVFKDDSAFSQDILQAVEDSVADGMDVINLSLGGGVQGPHDLLADGINAAVEAGVVAAVAAGNSGPGAFTVESPGSALNALTAGAITNPHFIGVPVTPDSHPSVGAVVGEFAALPSGGLSGGYSRSSPANGCGTAGISTNLVGQIAVINRGVCTFQEKVDNAKNAGAIGVIMVNNVVGDPIIMAGSGGVPAVMVSLADSSNFGTTGTATIGTTESEFVTTNSDIIASFSSRGPTPFTYLVKPDVTAPGVNVYSSVFDEANPSVFGFAMFQGTSMATPHLTGSAVLLKQLHPTWSPFDIKSAIVNTADETIRNADATGSPLTDVLARGTGRVNDVRANASPVSISPVSASFGFFNGNQSVAGSVTLTLSNLTGSPTTCTVNTNGATGITASSNTLTVATQTALTLRLNRGTSTTTPTGTYRGELTLNCGGTNLTVPWLVVVSREAKP